jgi:hypothetical protein
MDGNQLSLAITVLDSANTIYRADGINGNRAFESETYVPYVLIQLARRLREINRFRKQEIPYRCDKSQWVPQEVCGSSELFRVENKIRLIRTPAFEVDSLVRERKSGFLPRVSMASQRIPSNTLKNQ